MVSEAQSVVAGFNQNVDQQLLPRFPHIDNLLKLQSQQVTASLVSLNQQSFVSLISSSTLGTEAGAAIDTLIYGPIYSLKTPFNAYVTTTQTFETNLATVNDSLSSTSANPLALSDVGATMIAEAEAYRTAMDAGLQVTHSNLSTTVNSEVSILENTVTEIVNAAPTDAESQLSNAIATFDSAILDTTGLFGLNGPVAQDNTNLGYIPHDLVGKQDATIIDSVSGTGVVGGTATLNATLTTASGTGLIGKVVTFTLDGGFAGTAVTIISGVATLTGVPFSDTAGTDSGGIVASFSGDSTNLLS